MILSEILENCPEDFKQCQVVYESGWSDYEEAAWIIIFNFCEDLYSISYYDNVMSTDDFIFDPEQITYEELKEIKKEWDD